MSYTHLPVPFQMLANGNCLFDEVVKIFRNDWCQSFCFEDAQNFVASDKAHLCNTVRVSQYHTCMKDSILTSVSELCDGFNTNISIRRA